MIILFCLTTHVLFLVTAAMFFNRSKIHMVILCRILYGTDIKSAMQICYVDSEKKMLEEIINDDDGREMMAIAHLAYGICKNMY